MLRCTTRLRWVRGDVTRSSSAASHDSRSNCSRRSASRCNDARTKMRRNTHGRGRGEGGREENGDIAGRKVHACGVKSQQRNKKLVCSASK